MNKFERMFKFFDEILQKFVVKIGERSRSITKLSDSWGKNILEDSTAIYAKLQSIYALAIDRYIHNNTQNFSLYQYIVRKYTNNIFFLMKCSLYLTWNYFRNFKLSKLKKEEKNIENEKKKKIKKKK